MYINNIFTVFHGAYVIHLVTGIYQVVQDFVQATVEADSPREWLLSLMDTSSRESEYDINLLGQL